MQFEVIAESQEDFERWVNAQRQAAVAPVTPEAKRGLALVEYRCGLCHRVRGTEAGAISAPDLTHLMSRRTLAAGTLLNNPGNLEGWIQNPQNIKPGNLMPNQYLSAQELSAAIAYLGTLQ
jgi:cytochrome c oxidase subunit 2